MFKFKVTQDINTNIYKCLNKIEIETIVTTVIPKHSGVVWVAIGTKNRFNSNRNNHMFNQCLVLNIFRKFVNELIRILL